MKNTLIFFIASILLALAACNNESKNIMLVDVRTAEEYKEGSAKNAINIPLDEMENNLEKFTNKDEIHVFCRSGNRSSQAKLILESAGIKNVINEGPMENVLNKQQ